MEILTILAIITAPLIAVQVSLYLERRRETKKRRRWIFELLMANRATPLSVDFVRALNMIDVEFYGNNRKLKKVRNSWHALMDHFASVRDSEVWTEKVSDLQADLLMNMAESLDYEFDTTLIKKSAYYPKGLGEMEEDINVIRKNLIDLLSGKSSIPVSFEVEESEREEGKRLMQSMKLFFDGEKTIKFRVDKNDK